MKVYAAFPRKLFSQLKIAPSCSGPDVLAAHAVRAISQVMKPQTIKFIQLVYSWCPIYIWTSNAVSFKNTNKKKWWFPDTSLGAQLKEDFSAVGPD